MPIEINATCEVAKSFSVKREKRDDDTEAVIAHLKIADVMLDREQIDEVVGLPIGWSQSALFDEQGAPSLTLRDAEVSGITLDLTTLGALLSCGLAWEADGDVVDDIADLLGKLCAIEVVIEDGGQADLLRPAA